MKRLTLTLAILVVAATNCFSQDHGAPVTPTVTTRDTWIKYNSPEGRYSVSLPQQPKLSSQESTNSAGLKFTQYMATAEESGRLFMIGYFDYPAAFDIDKARDGVVQKLKATLLSESDLTIAGYPGREIKMSAKETDGSEFLIRARIYAVKNRAYFVQFIIGSTDTAPTAVAAATKYFDSFSVSVP